MSGLAPYTPGEQPKVADLIKLNTNEHPYGPSPRALEAIKAAANDSLRLYPDNDSSALCQAIADMYGLRKDQVFVGNGSDEILAHVFHGLFLRARRPLLMPDITYSFYRTYCRLYDVPHDIVPLDENFRIRVADYSQPRTPSPAGIIFANPNAPTGIALALEEIEQILLAHPDTVVVVDEAYVDFGGQSAVSLLNKHENLVVIQTLSKSRGLAGLRVGFALASAEIINGLLRVKDSFNSYPLDRLAQAGALASIQDTEHFRESCDAIVKTREALTESLEGLGFEVLPSQANFVFARHPKHSAADLSAALRERKVLVRHFRQPRIEEFLRITVGTEHDCEHLCKVLAEILKTHNHLN